MITLRSSKPKAKKEHKCNFCGGTIRIGEVYDHQSNVHDGEFYEWKSHSSCSRIAYVLDMYAQCDEGVNDDMFQETIRTEYIDLSDKQRLDVDRFDKFEDILFFVKDHHLSKIDKLKEDK